jgi:uncharacterized protein YceK
VGAVIRRASALLIVAACMALPGCLLGSPLAAISGKPYGMTRDDIKAISSKKRGPIWSGAPVFAAIDLPFAFVLDTAFAPIALPIWALSSDDDEGDDWTREEMRTQDRTTSTSR